MTFWELQDVDWPVRWLTSEDKQRLSSEGTVFRIFHVREREIADREGTRRVWQFFAELPDGERVGFSLTATPERDVFGTRLREWLQAHPGDTVPARLAKVQRRRRTFWVILPPS